MDASGSLFDRLSFAADNPFAAFEEGLALDVDLVVAGGQSLPEGRVPRISASLRDPDAWSTAAARTRERDLLRPRTRVASDDPHILGLGAAGMPAVFATPEHLRDILHEGRVQLGRPRRVLAHVNGPLAPGIDEIDVALALVREAGLEGLGGAAVDFSGSAVESMSAQQRANLCASAGPAGVRIALTSVDGDGRPWPAPGRPRAHDEYVIINADELGPLAFDPLRGVAAPLAAFKGRQASHVAIGGCVGGDDASIARILDRLPAPPPATRGRLSIVPESQKQLDSITSSPLGRSLVDRGARLCPPPDLAASEAPPDLVSCSCLNPDALVAGLPSLVASALRGEVTAWGTT